MSTIDDVAVIDEESKLSEASRALMKQYDIPFERIPFLNVMYKTLADELDTSKILETGKAKKIPEQALWRRVESEDITIQDVQRIYAVQAIGMHEIIHYEKGVVIRGSEKDGNMGLFRPKKEITQSYIGMMKGLVQTAELMAKNAPQEFAQYMAGPGKP